MQVAKLTPIGALVTLEKALNRDLYTVYHPYRTTYHVVVVTSVSDITTDGQHAKDAQTGFMVTSLPEL